MCESVRASVVIRQSRGKSILGIPMGPMEWKWEWDWLGGNGME